MCDANMRHWCFYFTYVFMCKLDSLARFKVIQRMFSPPGVVLNKCHWESCDSPDPLPKKWICFRYWTWMSLSHPWSQNTVSCPFTRALPHVSASFRKKKKMTGLLSSIRPELCPLLLSCSGTWKLQASGALVIQTDPVAPRGSSLSIMQRNKRDGSWVFVLTLAWMSCVTLPMNFIP